MSAILRTLGASAMPAIRGMAVRSLHTGISAVSHSPQSLSVVKIPSRSIAFFDNIKSKFTETSEQNKTNQMGEMFLSTREKLLAYPNFRLKEYHAIMKDAVDKLNTIHGKMGAMMQKEAAEEAKRSYSILDALTPVERANESVNVINMAVKARITAATGASATEINVELRKFDEMKSFHKWLHRRVSKGLRLPMTQAEALEMMIDDRPELSEKNRIEQRKKQRRAQR